MSNSILYYPTIEFRREDYLWLWTASLLWDKIYRIVPPNYVVNEPTNIKKLCESGEIGIPISPIDYRVDISDDFSNFMEEHRRDAAALTYHDSEYIKVHESKIDVKLQHEFMYDMGVQKDQNGWLYLNPQISNFYMTFLANHIAKKNDLSLYTDNRELWVASTYFLFDGRIQNNYFPGENFCEPSSEALVSLMLPEFYPTNILDISPELLLRFREKRKDERIQFIEAINSFREKLSAATAPEVISVIVNDEKKKIEKATTNYKKSMDILKVVKFGGIMTTLLTITADALGYNPLSQTTSSILATSGMGLNILTGLGQKIIPKPTNNPYTYLAQIKSTFDLHHYVSNDTSMSLVDKYNYTLYREFEEFIED